MTEETIKINREMLRGAWDKVFRERQLGGFGAIDFIETELFGAPQPQELWLAIHENKVMDSSFEERAPMMIRYSGKTPPSGGWSWRKFREVIES